VGIGHTRRFIVLFGEQVLNLILQHFEGTMPEWAYYCEKTVKRYAEMTGADYQLIRGFPMGKELGFTPQKLCLLLEKYDEYDQVCMIDMDTIATKRYQSFWNRPEIGVLHDRAIAGPKALNAVTRKPHPSKTPEAAPNLYKQGSWCFFGNWIKLNREQRQELRKHWNQKLFEESLVDKHPGDEVILHYLFHQSKILDGKHPRDVCMRTDYRDGEDLCNLKFREDSRWDKKFCNQPEDSDPDASLIHFCAGRKRQIVSAVKSIYGNMII